MSMCQIKSHSGDIIFIGDTITEEGLYIEINDSEADSSIVLSKSKVKQLTALLNELLER